MEFYVLSNDGQRFGPVNVDTLNEWIRQDRVKPSTVIEDAESGVQMTAKAVNGITFLPDVAEPHPAPTLEAFQSELVSKRSPIAGNEQNMAFGVVKREWTWAWVCTIAAPIVMLVCYFGLFLAMYGFWVGFRLRNEPGSRALALALPNTVWILAFVAWCIHTPYALPLDIRL